MVLVVVVAVVVVSLSICLSASLKTQDVEKVHPAVARSTYRSQNGESTCPDHFLTFRCRFAWQVQLIVHLFKSEQNVRAL